MAKHHTLDTSVDALLVPERLSELAGQPITSVRRQPLGARYAKSGSRLSLVETNQGLGPRFTLKQVSAEWDWQMRATADHSCRAVALWQYGVLDRLPSEIKHGILTCAIDGDGWAILMKDYNPLLLPYAPFSAADNAFFMDAMASLHAAFFQDPALLDPSLNLCRIEQTYSVFSRQVGLQQMGGADEVPQRIVEGWDLLPTLVDPDVAEITLSLMDDPGPLVAALARYPFTLVHGDWRHANQGLVRRPFTQLILLDWQLATVAPPAVEIGRCLTTNSALFPGSKEDCIDCYRHQLARRLGDRFSASWWQPQLALALLGGFVQDGWAIGLKATHWDVGANARERWQEDLQWWSTQVRRAVEWL
jgi:hypothetical protein